MTYKPLPKNLTIKQSKIHGLGLFATEDIKKQHEFGISHIMNEYFEGSPSDPDFAIPAARDHYQGIVERLDLMLTYHNIPQGFLHRAVAPVDLKSKIIKNYCLVEHLSNKYANQNSQFAVIKVEDLFF